MKCYKLVMQRPVLQWLNPFLESPYYFPRKYAESLTVAYGLEGHFDKHPLYKAPDCELVECLMDDYLVWQKKIEAAREGSLYKPEIMQNLVWVSKEPVPFDLRSPDFKACFDPMLPEERAGAFAHLFLDRLARGKANIFFFTDGEMMYLFI